jgi:hypothetical protein
MCDRCVELDGKIEHYRRLMSGIADQATLDGIKELIERMKNQKATLHPDQPPQLAEPCARSIQAAIRALRLPKHLPSGPRGCSSGLCKGSEDTFSGPASVGNPLFI